MNSIVETQRELDAIASQKPSKALLPKAYVNLPFTLLTANDLLLLPPTKWRIKNILPEKGLASAFGASGSGKTFLVLDLAHALANGSDWFGYKVNACPVVYIALEGEGGIAKRVNAYGNKHGNLSGVVRYLVQPFDLLKDKQIRELAMVIKEAGCSNGIVIIDTLNRAASIDENNSESMSRVLSNAKLLQTLTNGLILLVHHSGKDLNKGMRGHSSLHAALDAAIEVSRDGDSRSWKLFKAKDGEDGKVHPFNLEIVNVGSDDEGDAITSCVIAEDCSTEVIKRVKLPQGGTQRIVYEAACELLKNSVYFGKSGAPASRPCIELENAILTIADKLTCRVDQKKVHARRAITSMCGKGLFKVNEGWLWLI